MSKEVTKGRRLCKTIIDGESKYDYRQRKQDDHGPIETKARQADAMKESQA
jgi:hypothetical protein